jgi:signal transduction histidine kinase
LSAGYYGGAHLGFALAFSGPVAAIVWLPVGIGIAFLYLAGLQFWPGVVVGDLLVNNYSALPFAAALGQSFGNLLEVVVATLLLRRLVGRRGPLASVGGVARMVLAIAAGTAVSATIGSLSLWLGHVITAGALPDVWRTWWLGDASGALLVAPLALAWSGPLDRELWRRRALEAGLALAAVAGLSMLAMNSYRPLMAADQSVSGLLNYLVFPALIWIAVRLRQRGATLAVAVAAGFAVWATTHYVGPFHSHSLTRSVLETQLFIAVASLSTLCLAAVVSERERFARRLWASRIRLVEAADAERRRLEHNLHDGAQQRLTALLIRLSLAAERVQDAPEDAAELFDEAATELEIAIDELRELSHGIQPTRLTEFGLATALAGVAACSKIPVELSGLPSMRLDDTAEATAYYVVAEAITNAHKHARASSIQVSTRMGPGVLRVEVVDDGVGGAIEQAGSGLQGLRDRVEAIGGRFEVESAPGRGTWIAAAIPAAKAGS